MTKSKAAYSTLTSRTTLALGNKLATKLCGDVEEGLFKKGTERQINRVLNAIGVDTTTGKELKTALKCAPTLVLDTLADTWRPRTTPTRCDVFFQIKDVQYQITNTIDRIQYELRAQTTTKTTTTE